MIRRTVAIHDGPFHADEVTACALLIVFGLIDRDKVVRTRNLDLLKDCDFVCDVGGVYDPERRRFDHHQADYAGSMSSAGMVLEYLKKEAIVDEEEYGRLRESLVAGVDAHDNGVASPPGICTFSFIIANFAPVAYDASSGEWQEQFEAALSFTIDHLKRSLARLRYNRGCRAEVEQAMKGATQVLMFERRLPWLENFFALGGEEHPAQFVIMPSDEHWKLRGIPPNLERRMEVRCPLPEEWGGLLDDELARVSGIPGAIFCHKGRFVSVWRTREEALLALEKVLA
jgi:uncharacterized UPF0160 family protein